MKKPANFEKRPADCWIMSKCNSLVKDVTENMDKFELGIALSKIYDFMWDEFCDWYIEMANIRSIMQMKIRKQPMRHCGH